MYLTSIVQYLYLSLSCTDQLTAKTHPPPYHHHPYHTFQHPTNIQNDATTHGTTPPTYHLPVQIQLGTLTKTKPQLSKEDEVSSGNSTDNEVRREDQEKINRFSRLHQRETVLLETLKGKQVLLPLSQHPSLWCFVPGDGGGCMHACWR